MFNLVDIIVTVAWLTVFFSIWGIYYFIVRIIYTVRDRWDDERMQELIERKRKKSLPHSTKISRSGKNTL
jgi:hypothetical protein